MANEWVTSDAVAVDAMGVEIPGVTAAREIPGGIEVVMVLVDVDGNDLVMSRDNGVTLDTVQTVVEIPGGEIFEV